MKNKKGFTLAEIIVVLTLLGVVASIVIPSTIKRSQDKANKLKIKKALTTYEQVIDQIQIIQGVKNIGIDTDSNNMATLYGWTSSNECTNGRTLFKIKKDKEKNNCIFQTYDGIWWNIKDIRNTIVAVDEKCIEDVDRKEDSACYNKSFYLTVKDSDDGKYFAINKTDGKACNTLVYAKILPESTSCGADSPVIDTPTNTYTPSEKYIDWRYNVCNETTKINGKYAGCRESFETIEINSSGGINTYDKDGNVVFVENYAAGICAASTSDNCKKYGVDLIGDGDSYHYTKTLDGTKITIIDRAVGSYGDWNANLEINGWSYWCRNFSDYDDLMTAISKLNSERDIKSICDY